MARSPAMSSYWRGMRDSIPFLLIVTPFGLLFGVVATEAGLTVIETVTFSVAVVAGAAQFAALQLMVDNAPTLVVLGSALAVNLRHAMYSASLVPHLGKAPLWQRALVSYVMVDQTYAMAMARYENEPHLTLPEKVAFFFGCATLVLPAWFTVTVVGALIGAQIPDSVGLDFALPLCFLALIAPMLRTLAHVAAAFAAVVVALLAAGLPFNLGLMCGGVAGMITGAFVETRLPEHMR